MKLTVLDLITPPDAPAVSSPRGTGGTGGTAPKTGQIERPTAVPQTISTWDKTGVTVSACSTTPRNVGQAWNAKDTVKQGVSHVSHVSHVKHGESANDSTFERQRAMARAWAEAYERIGALEYPDDGRAVLACFFPSLLATWDEREVLAESASVAFVAGQAQAADLAAALIAWETAVAGAIRHLARTCHGCGREIRAAVVLDDGQRACSRCQDSGTRICQVKEGH